MVKQIISLKEYLSNILYLLKTEDPICAYMYCNTRKIRNEIVIINIEELSKDITIQELKDILDGKCIKI